ncbi:MAG TPA: hypothetical protein VLT33_16435 [Labilithrix sp.]|nr:hypothetical protein [Labilithrix sp.]
MSRALRVILAAAAAALLLACASLKTAPPDAGAGDGGVDEGGADAGPETGFTIVRQNAEAGAFRTVWVGGPETVYIAGDNGALIEKKGEDWVDVPLGSGVDVGGVWASGPSEALAVATTRNTNSGPIFRRTNGRWIQVGTAPHGLRSVWGSGNVRYVVGNDGVVYSGPPSDPLGTGFLVEPNEFVAKTLFLPIFFSVGGNDDKRVMIAGDFDMTVFFDGTWHSFADPIDRTRSFRAIWGPAGSPTVDIYQGANYYGLWHFTGSANAVTQLNEEKDEPQNFNRWIWGIWGPSGDKVICVGDAGRIMTFDRKTGLVTKQPSPTTKSLYAIGGTSLDDIWIVGADQLVLHGHLSF